MPTVSVYIKTYGCQMNERDSEQVAQMLVARGYSLTQNEQEADVILLNTCSVRDMAEQKAIGKMGMLQQLRKKKPQMILGYLGCMAQSRGADLLKVSPAVDLIVGTQKFHQVADYLDQLLEQRAQARMDDERLPIVDIDAEEDSQNTIQNHVLKAQQTTAFVSIMQGCNMHCTFCIVPFTRGPERSRPIAEIVREVQELVDQGVKEVTLLGQIVNLYGRHEFPKHEGKSPFVQLLEAVHAVSGLERIRFTSPHPIGFREDLIRSFLELPKLMEHVHLPVQSGSNRLLKKMHRPYKIETFLKIAEQLKEAQVAITTDVIVGFPGETQEDHEATRKIITVADNSFVFRYSQRKDTPAAKMEDQVPESLKEERHQDLLAVVNANMASKLKTYIGKDVEILCEGPSRYNTERLTGRTRSNKIVVFPGHARHVGEIFQLRIVDASLTTLYGDPAIVGNVGHLNHEERLAIAT